MTVPDATIQSQLDQLDPPGSTVPVRRPPPCAEAGIGFRLEASVQGTVLAPVQETVIEYCRLGGGIAYTLLFENRRLHAEQRTEEGRAALELIMTADADALGADADFNFFSFFVAKPKKTGSVKPEL